MEPLSDFSTSSASTASTHPKIDRATQAAHETIDRVAAKAGPALEKVRSAADGMSDKPQQWAESLRGQVRQNPLVAVGASVLVGLLIGKISR
jgi:ElaB/YqjD/DUF883 family membrane-anchored ribosome-binding protein